MPLSIPPGTKIVPTDDSLFVRLYQPTGMVSKDANIIVPETAREVVFVAHILSVGPGRLLGRDESGSLITMPMDYKVGQDVVYSRYAGERFQQEGWMYALLKRDDILGVVEWEGEEAKNKAVEWAGTDYEKVIQEGRSWR